MLSAPKLTGLSGGPGTALFTRDTWLNGSGGLEIQSLRAGG